MRVILYLFAMVLFLASCATSPAPEFVADAHVIDADQLSEYWVPSKETISFRLNAQHIPDVSCGFVVLEFLIDSNGNVFNPVIKEAEPEGDLDYAALKNLSLTKYVPAESNPGRTPVKVTERHTFKFDDVDCE